MRCPEVIVDAVNDIIVRAQKLKKLEGRIKKPYKYFAPTKGGDSDKYPKIALVRTSIQRESLNYMGRYIADAIARIPKDELEAAGKGGYPAALVIAVRPYSGQIIACLKEGNFTLDIKEDGEDVLDRVQGLRILKENEKSNLGWRIVIEAEDEGFAADLVDKTAKLDRPMIDVMPSKYREKILAEARQVESASDGNEEDRELGKTAAMVKVTSFEGAKGLSAQHVFIAGLHNGEIPKDPDNVRDLEICKFVVGLTRTRKRCYLIHTGRFGAQQKRPCLFISWIEDNRFECIEVNAAYWR
jgi:superfamily I DNA/RNA helicase